MSFPNVPPENRARLVLTKNPGIYNTKTDTWRYRGYDAAASAEVAFWLKGDTAHKANDLLREKREVLMVVRPFHEIGETDGSS